MKKTLFLFSLITSSLLASAQCDFGSHSINWEDAWLSCETSENPNPARTEGHWIMYDLGSPHAFFESHIWNLNIPDETGQGARNCFFDFSVDGQTWEEWGNFEVAEAPGNDSYAGDAGPYFDGAVGRYLLITIDTNWDGSDCSGFCEIKVDVEDTTVEVEELSASLEFNAFPNPVNDVLTIRHYESGNLTLEVYNTSGQIIYSDQMYGSTIYLTVNEWESGLYLVVLRNEQGISAVRRVIKE